MHAEADYPVVLTIAGSDSSGGAGIQADLKTFSVFGVHGMSAITCVTAQNPNEVTGLVPIEPEMVRQQIRTVCSVFPVRAAKTGMLHSAETIRAVVAADVVQGIPILVVDPVMVTASGTRLLQASAVEALCSDLLPEARVVTPNVHEAEILAGHTISTVDELIAAAREIGNRYDVACVVKGGHLNSEEVVDVLYDEGEEHIFTGPRIPTEHTHGAGCAFSAAVTACLARRELMTDAVAKAKQFVTEALRRAYTCGPFKPLCLTAEALEEA